ncbi:MAG: GH36 C-terminal domain-containing protein [Mediterraneibacter gnavus]
MFRFWQDLHTGFRHCVCRGLDPKAEYKNVETGEVFGGDELMYAGITIPRVQTGFFSAQ